MVCLEVSRAPESYSSIAAQKCIRCHGFHETLANPTPSIGPSDTQVVDGGVFVSCKEIVLKDHKPNSLPGISFGKEDISCIYLSHKPLAMPTDCPQLILARLP